MYTYGNPSTTTTSLDLVTSVFEVMQAEAYKVKLPELFWKKCINTSNLDTEVGTGAEIKSYRIRDEQGMAAFISTVGANLPTVSMSQGKISVPVESAAIFAHIDDDEAARIQNGYGESLSSEYGGIMRRAIERLIERTFFYGAPQLGFFGYLKHPLVPVLAAMGQVHTLSGEQNVSMFSSMYISVLNQTNQIWYPDTLDLPSETYNFLSTQIFNPANASNVYTLDMIKQALSNVAQKPVMIQAIPHLKGAGATGENRAKLYTKNARDNQKMPYPVPFHLVPPQKRGLGVDVFAKARFGSYTELNPLSGTYLDGI